MLTSNNIIGMIPFKEALESWIPENDFVKKEIINALDVREAIAIASAKCKDELDKIERGEYSTPPGLNPDNAMWQVLMEERIEYLESLQGTFEFLLNNENRKLMTV